ncbi:MAG: hypothetical protein K8953_04060, partial [Proteobacteria bacterium]|nr:hypothetical protein [Pseudomonadota bacterium]
ITDACMIDPFDAVCTPFATQYSGARNTRLETCRGDAATRGVLVCTGSLPTICAEGDTPFAQVCKNYDTTQAVIAQTCATDTDPTNTLCDTVVLPVSDGDDVLVKDCIKKPYTAGCAKSVFSSARVAICESVETSFTAGCLTDSDFVSINANDARPVKARLITRCANPNSQDRTGCDTIDAEGTRAMLIVRCSSTNPVLDKTGCDMDIGNGTTLAQCITNPFMADCVSPITLAECIHAGGSDCSAEVVATALMTYRDAFVARCDDGMNNNGCDGLVAAGKSITFCTDNPADIDCAVSGAFDTYIVSDCTQAANVFAPRCQGGIDEAVITARAELALNCAADTGTDCDMIIVSGSLTVDNCNDTPFAIGCEDAAFANARFEMCKTAEPKPAACGVEDGQGYTSYVQGGVSKLELGDSIYKDTDELATYRENDPVLDKDGNRVLNNSATVLDESKTQTGTDYDPAKKVERDIEEGGLTLNDLVTATDNEKSGFAFAYISGGRGADNINGWDRYYAGLLSGTSIALLGGALTDAPTDATWYGKIFIVNGSTRTEQADFELTIDFAAKTLTSGDIAVPRLGGRFVINGKFNGSVIYGATRLYDGLNNGLSSIGSLTGLIGQNGAVGAFVS